MSNEIRLAFDHPAARSEADEGGDTLHDRISLRDHVVEVEIGAFQSERGATQRLRFNVVVELKPLPQPLDDDVDKILSYDTITEAIAAALAEERLNLLETLAERVAHGILAAPQALRVFVRIEKLDRGPGALGVEIVRRKSADLAEPAVQHGPAPLVLFLTNDTIGAADLPRLLDSLEAAETPVVLCVGPADLPAPQSAVAGAQRRIDLLAIEQNAWVLAGRDKRCVVTDTRTEIDWAIKRGNICVWAPSKIVLDAIDGPSASPRDAVALALWFAQHLEASRMAVIGADGAADGAAPVEMLSLDRALTEF